MEIPTLSEGEKWEMMREMFVLNKQIAEKGWFSDDWNKSQKKKDFCL